MKPPQMPGEKDHDYELRWATMALSPVQNDVDRPSMGQLTAFRSGQVQKPALYPLGQDERVGSPLMWNITHKPLSSNRQKLWEITEWFPLVWAQAPTGMRC